MCCSFWSDYSISQEGKGFEPKRAFTFLFQISGRALVLEDYLIKDVKKPSFKITETKHPFLNHTFYYPGKIEWDPVDFTVVDVVNPNGTQKFLQLLQASGYNSPTAPPGLDVSAGTLNAQTISKLRSVDALGIPIIRQIDADGNTVDEWRLKGAWVSKVEFGDLDYDKEDLMKIKCSIRYDWAYNTIVQPSGLVLPTNAGLGV